MKLNAKRIDGRNQPAEEAAVHTRPLLGGITKKHVGKGKVTFVERDLFESDACWSFTGAAPQMLSMRD